MEPSSVILVKFAALTCGVGFFMTGSLGLVFEPLEASIRLLKIWIGWLPDPTPVVVVRPPQRRSRETVQIVKFTPRPAGGTCGVCAAALEGEVVHCHDCDAAHHRACFAYNTRCATYACGCTETVESGRTPVRRVHQATIWDYWD